MERAVSHFEKNLLKIVFYFILISMLGLFSFAYFYLLEPLGGMQFVALFEKQSSVYPSRVMSVDKIVAGQEKRGKASPVDFSLIPDIFSVSERKQPTSSGEEKWLLLNLTVNGESGIGEAGFGDTLSYSIVYKNQGETDLKNLELRIDIDSTSRDDKMVLDWATLEDKNAGKIIGLQIFPELRRGVISWTRQQIDKFSKLAPGEEGRVDFKINVKPFSEFGGWKIENLEVKSTAIIKIADNSNIENKNPEESNIVTFRIKKGTAEDGNAVSTP